METQNSYNKGPQIERPEVSRPKFNGRAFAGLIIVFVGTAFLLRQMGMPLPGWLFSWQMLLIVIGLFNGVRNSFRGIGWLILIVIGSVFLANDLVYDFAFHRYFWPILIIALGLYMIVRPKKKDNFWTGDMNSSEDFFDATAIMGGVKKNIISKNFRGGDVTSIFGGSEIILTQADINGTAVLDLTTIFGGAKIIVPSNWTVKSDDLTAILGGYDDKRAIIANASPDPNKVLVLKGLVMFGGIELKSL